MKEKVKEDHPVDTTFGALCLIPPILAIILALVTKQTILSLFVATWVGSTIVNGWNPLVGFAKIVCWRSSPRASAGCWCWSPWPAA